MTTQTRRPTSAHTVEKLSSGGYRCTNCHIQYKTKPYRRDCQGIPRYNIRAERPKHLFTEKELARKGKQPNSEPEGYVRMLNRPYWIYLYDINQAVPLVQSDPCDLCQKPSGKLAEQKIGASYSPATDEQTLVPYKMPVHCDTCQKDISALSADMSDMEQIRREWQEYRNEGLGNGGQRHNGYTQRACSYCPRH
jgi:hypothetical protein